MNIFSFLRKRAEARKFRSLQVKVETSASYKFFRIAYRYGNGEWEHIKKAEVDGLTPNCWWARLFDTEEEAVECARQMAATPGAIHTYHELLRLRVEREKEKRARQHSDLYKSIRIK